MSLFITCLLLGVDVHSWLCPAGGSCFVLVVGCRLSSADCILSGVAVGGSCLVLVAGCRCRLLLLVPGVGCRLPGVRC